MAEAWPSDGTDASIMVPKESVYQMKSRHHLELVFVGSPSSFEEPAENHWALAQTLMSIEEGFFPISITIPWEICLSSAERYV